MKVFKISMILFVLLFCLSTVSAVERLVPPNQAGALQGFIDNSDPGDVLLLQAGGTYPNVGSVIIDTNFTIRSIGDTKALGQPRIIEIANASGDFQKLTVSVKGDVTFIDILFDGQLKGQADDFSNARHLRMLEPGLTVVVDSCTFVRAGARSIGLPKPNQTITITNSLWVDSRSNTSNGRDIDFREGPHKYIKLQNNSTYLTTDRIFRHYWFGKTRCPAIDTLIIDHNTFTNNLGYRNPFTLGPVKYLQFTNNLMWNTGQEASDTTTNRMAEVTYIIDSVVTHWGPNEVCQMGLTEAADYNTVVVMENNNFYLDAAFDPIIAKYDNITKMPIWNAELGALIDDADKAYFSEALVLGKVPGPWPDDMDDWYAIVDTLTEKIEPDPFDGNLDTLYLHKQPGFAVEHPWKLLDYTYPTGSVSYTRAAGGFPVGDLNWWPTKKQEWIDAGMPVTAIDDIGQRTPQEFSLSQNYPNPFNPTTTISYTLAKAGHVNITIYNTLGQKVRTLVDQKMAAGAQTAVWNGFSDTGSFVATGVYFYQMNAGSHVMVKKMLLIK